MTRAAMATGNVPDIGRATADRPGVMHMPMAANASQDPAAERPLPANPPGRFVQPDEIDALIAVLSEAASGYMEKQILLLDGRLNAALRSEQL